MKQVTEERAERIAKSTACENCGEYSFKHVAVEPANEDRQASLGIAWLVTRTCGVCGAEHELGIAPNGAIVYVS